MRLGSIWSIGTLCISLTQAAPEKPNVLLVVIDDLGWTDVGFRSHDIRTPTIDRLAKDGIILDQYYVPAVCSPSRATFMTGRYPMHHGVVDWIQPTATYGLPLNETTLADKFKEAGYVTRAVGKWHLGFFKEQHTPTFRGFDSFYGFYLGGQDYFKHIQDGFYDFRRDSSPKCGAGCSEVVSDAAGQYTTTLFSEEAVRVVKSHPTDKPLFMYLAYQAVHAPAEVPQAYMDAYKTTIADPMRRKFAGMLTCVDEGLTNLTAALQEKGMMDNTLIVFSTDNGGGQEGGDAIGSRNWPLRGGKHSIFEGGTRGIAFVSGKMLKKTGYTFTHLMHNADWMPTFGAIAGFDTSSIPLPIDGVNQWAALNAGNNHAPQRTGFVYGNSTDLCTWNSKGIPCGFGIRDKQWKLTQGYGGGPDYWCNQSSAGFYCSGSSSDAKKDYHHPQLPECARNGFCLWDIHADPFEKHEISKAHPKVVDELKQKLKKTLQTFRQEQPDPSCGHQKFIHDKKVGKVWTPWCDQDDSMTDIVV